MRRFLVVLVGAGSLALPAAALAQPDIVVTAATASPNPARTGEEVTITITATNAGSTAPAYPVYLRLELQSQSMQFGTSSATCPPGATQTKPNEECRLDNPLAPGQTATMTIGGFSPEATAVDFRGIGYAYDDPNHDNDAQGGRLVVEGSISDGSRPGTGGGIDAGLGPFRLPRPTLSTRRFKEGRSTTVTVELDRPVELATLLELRERGRWKRVRGGPSSRARAGRHTLKLGPRYAGRPLEPGRYRLTLFATSRTGERAVADPVTFTITAR